MSLRKSDLSKEIKACTTTYPPEFLRSLPQDFERLYKKQSFLDMLEQFSIGPSFSSDSSNSSIQLPTYLPTLIAYYELNANVQRTDEIIGKLSVLGVTSLYSSDSSNSSACDSVASGLLTVLSAHCAPQQLEKSGIAETLRSGGYDIRPRRITVQELDRYFLQELNTFVTNSAVHRHHRDFYKFAITIGLSSLLFLGKTVTSESINDYLGSKWQVLASHVGCDKLVARKPNYRNCNAIPLFFSTFNRAAFFELYRSLAKQQTNRFRTAFGFVVESLKWADMEYIHLIDKYVVKKNPELLSLQNNMYFGSEKDRMKHVYKLMERLPEFDHPFLKLLLPLDQLGVLTRENFKYLYGAARAIASVDDETVGYINREDTEFMMSMKNQFRNYALQKKSSGLNV